MRQGISVWFCMELFVFFDKSILHMWQPGFQILGKAYFKMEKTHSRWPKICIKDLECINNFVLRNSDFILKGNNFCFCWRQIIIFVYVHWEEDNKHHILPSTPKDKHTTLVVGCNSSKTHLATKDTRAGKLKQINEE
jgi:hypothetical protein